MCVQRPRVIVLTQSYVAQWHSALCPVSASTAFRLSRQFWVYFADNPFSIFVLIILFAQARKQARFIFLLEESCKKKSASFRTKSTCDITSCGLHRHLHFLSFEIFSYGRNCKYSLFSKMFMYKKNGSEELKWNHLYENLRFFERHKEPKASIKTVIFTVWIFINCRWKTLYNRVSYFKVTYTYLCTRIGIWLVIYL